MYAISAGTMVQSLVPRWCTFWFWDGNDGLPVGSRLVPVLISVLLHFWWYQAFKTSGLLACSKEYIKMNESPHDSRAVKEGAGGAEGGGTQMLQKRMDVKIGSRSTSAEETRRRRRRSIIKKNTLGG